MWSEWPPEFTLSKTPSFSQQFPHLTPEACTDGLSPATRSYNCISWAASVTDVRWDPDPYFQYYWPDGAPRGYGLDAFIAAFRSRGFEVCLDGSLEVGVEKIAIYTLNEIPQHAARQLKNGNWTSKMGDYEDIQHPSLLAVGGPFYGTVEIYMARGIA